MRMRHCKGPNAKEQAEVSICNLCALADERESSPLRDPCDRGFPCRPRDCGIWASGSGREYAVVIRWAFVLFAVLCAACSSNRENTERP